MQECNVSKQHTSLNVQPVSNIVTEACLTIVPQLSKCLKLRQFGEGEGEGGIN